MVDACFSEPRLVALYDVLDGPRDDLVFYTSIATELGAGAVIDVGCGTGTLACQLAERGHTVTGIDPAAASIAIACVKPFAERVRWIVGEITDLDPSPVDLVTMTGNVAEVFLSDTAWDATLRACRSALLPGGYLVFETRDPRREPWRRWTPKHTARQIVHPELGTVQTQCEVTAVTLPYVSFRWTYTFQSDGATERSDSTLRFRDGDELTATLRRADFELTDVRDPPDRPGTEMIFVARARDR